MRRSIEGLVALFAVVAVPSCSGEPPGSVAGRLEQAVYGGCPTPEELDGVCQFYEGENSVAVTGCADEVLFAGCSDGERVSVRAADDQGEFPTTFFIWKDGGQVTGEGCKVTGEKNDPIMAHIRDGKIKCRIFLTFTDANGHQFTYAEHFASNPSSQCLGWLECTVPSK